MDSTSEQPQPQVSELTRPTPPEPIPPIIPERPQPSLDTTSESQEAKPTGETGLVEKLDRAQADLKSAENLVIEKFHGIMSDANSLAAKIKDRLPVTSKDTRSDGHDIHKVRGDMLIGRDGRAIKASVHSWLFLRNAGNHYSGNWINRLEFMDPSNPNVKVVMKKGSDSNDLDFGDTITLLTTRSAQDRQNWEKFAEVSLRESAEKRVSVEKNPFAPVDRDPLDAAREGLDYFVQHAEELKPIENPALRPPGAPPAQPAPSV